MSHTPTSIAASLEGRTTTNSIQLDALQTLPKEKLGSDAEAGPSHFEDDIPDGGLQAWCATFGGYVACILHCRPYLIITQSTDIILYLRLRELVWCLPELLRARRHLNIIQHQLDRLITTLHALLCGPSRRPTVRRRVLPLATLLRQHSLRLLVRLLYLASLLHSPRLHHSIFMLSLADPSKYYQLLLAQGIGMGVGGGFMLVPALSLQGHYWKKRRSMALGLVVCGSGCGGIVYPIMVNHLISSSSVGFAWGVRATGFLTLGLLAIAQLLMRTRMPNRKDRGEQPPKPNIVEVLTAPSFVFTVLG